jgi:NADH-quinone oxidoreductase subunit J
MNLEQLIFGATFIVALGSAIAMLFAPNAVHVALFLVGTQVALAVAFLLEGAFFIAALQIIIYAGAIMVLFLFVIMLLGVDRRERLIEPIPGQRALAFGLGALLAVEIAYIAFRGVSLAVGVEEGSEALTALNRDPGNVESIARALFGNFLLPFEATSVLLVVAIVGVMVLAKRIGSIQVALGGDTLRESDAA